MLDRPLTDAERDSNDLVRVTGCNISAKLAPLDAGFLFVEKRTNTIPMITSAEA
mgnify:CR=1 FL=1